jgi:hypothetical protein
VIARLSDPRVAILGPLGRGVGDLPAVVEHQPHPALVAAADEALQLFGVRRIGRPLVGRPVLVEADELALVGGEDIEHDPALEE